MMTGELSGGMQQGLGLARALATDPEVLLMDEAFGALDPLIRANLQEALLDMEEKLHRTIVLITPDLGEALKIGHRIAIMKDGAIVQIGTPQEILTPPADDCVQSFVNNVDRSSSVTARTLMWRHGERIRLRNEGPLSGLRMMRAAGVSASRWRARTSGSAASFGTRTWSEWWQPALPTSSRTCARPLR